MSNNTKETSSKRKRFYVYIIVGLISSILFFVAGYWKLDVNMAIGFAFGTSIITGICVVLLWKESKRSYNT